MSADSLLLQDAVTMRHAVQAGSVRAGALVEACLARIAATDDRVNAFTARLATRARARAAALDARGPAALCRLPLAGVPFAVKNLFDVQGLPTLAGSAIERDAPPATRDACLVERLEAAGAVLVGTLNMDEYAYGFTTENSHVGPTRNPHDLSRIAGGSSGGSAAALAAGQVPLTLGSDTNGSIRVPASLCGVFGLKPSFGRLPRSGSYPFVDSLDHLGPFARTATDLALAYDLMQGHDPGDASCATRDAEPVLPTLAQGVAGLRVAVLGGHFQRQGTPPARAAVQAVAEALADAGEARLAPVPVDLPLAEAGRAAAFLITNATGAALHLPDLRRRAQDFEPLSRDRFLAGALLPAAWIDRAQRVRRRYAAEALRVFEHHDLLLAPATPCAATPIGAEVLELDGQRLPLRPSMGLLAQPISCLGWPVCTVPVWLPGAALPIGVQLIAAPWREDRVLRAAAVLEAHGAVRAPVAAVS